MLELDTDLKNLLSRETSYLRGLTLFHISITLREKLKNIPLKTLYVVVLYRCISVKILLVM